MKELVIGGVKASELTAQYGTPLYVYDQQKLEANLEAYTTYFKSDVFQTRILYASKAFQTIGMLDLIAEYGLGKPSGDCTIFRRFSIHTSPSHRPNL